MCASAGGPHRTPFWRVVLRLLPWPASVLCRRAAVPAKPSVASTTASSCGIAHVPRRWSSPTRPNCSPSCAAGCIRHEIGTCLGPCAGACSRPVYGEHVRAARTFLEGKEAAPVETLERDMQAAAVAQQFERAARCGTGSCPCAGCRTSSPACARPGKSYPSSIRCGYGGKTHWYLIRCGHVAAVLPAPGGPASCQAAAQKIDAVFHAAQAGIGAPPGGRDR